jgi:endonuclease YncB( thermonuclease family)
VKRAIKIIGSFGIILAIATWPTKVTRVIDGDTVVLSNGVHVRLIGIDTPEKNTCFAGEATKLAENLLLGQKITLTTDIDNLDQFGRTLGYLTTEDGTLINLKLLQLGAGEYFLDNQNSKYQKEFIAAATTAHDQKLGMWKNCGPCDVKGNYDIHGKRYYHLPSFRHYNQVVVNLDKGDRWLCGEDLARKAGYTKARE